MNIDPSQNFQINIVQGSTYIRQIQYINTLGNQVNLSGYTAQMIFRTTVQDIGSPIISLTTSNSSIVINAVSGTVTFTISSTITGLLNDGQTMFYNLFITSPTGVVTPLLSGPSLVYGSTIR